MRVLSICIAVIALSACHPKPAKQPAANDIEATADAGPHKGVDRSHKGEPVPSVEILDAMSSDTGSRTNLRELQDGQPMLVNLWASWCAPCVKELPTLQSLQNQQGNKLKVVPVSQDSGPQQSVEAFLAKIQGVDFVAFQDPKMALSGALGAEVLPTSILYDAKGREVWRYVGDLDWTSAAAAKLLAEGDAPQTH